MSHLTDPKKAMNSTVNLPYAGFRIKNGNPRLIRDSRITGLLNFIWPGKATLHYCRSPLK